MHPKDDNRFLDILGGLLFLTAATIVLSFVLYNLHLQRSMTETDRKIRAVIGAMREGSQ